MSLLLDALKKAQKDKAEKDSDKTSSSEQAENSNQSASQSAPEDQARASASSELSQAQQHDEENLSIDDVTEFMGEGLNQVDLADKEEQQIDSGLPEDSPAKSDRNESEGASIDQYIASDTEKHQPEQHPAYALAEESLELEILNEAASPDEPEVEDETHPLSSSNVSLDIDQFTSDLTIRRQDLYHAKKSRTDNYEKTLLKVSEPSGLYDNTDTKNRDGLEMSPEYARKIFLKKNVSSRLFYFKIYTAISLVLLLIIALWGLFRVEEKFDQIEQGLVGLKNDPMPDIGRANIDRSSGEIAAAGKDGALTKTIGILAKADSQMQIEIHAQAEALDETPAAQSESNQPVAESGFSDQGRTTDMAGSSDQLSALGRQPTALNNQAGQNSASPSRGNPIQLSSRLRISQQDSLLQQAYQAYESDDIDQARRAYDQVLEMEAENRDGLLGRAAIHVIDQQYQAAIDKYQLILERNPNDSMALTSLISVAKIDPEAGESQLKLLLRQQPDTAYLHFALGNMYGNQQRWSEAQSAYFNALQLAKTDPDYAYNLAVSLEHLGKPEAAIAYYQRALVNSRDTRANFDRQRVRQRIEVLGQ